MKRLAIVAAVMFIAAAACRAEREDAMMDTAAPAMAPPPAMMDTMPMDTMPMGDTAVMR